MSHSSNNTINLCYFSKLPINKPFIKSPIKQKLRKSKNPETFKDQLNNHKEPRFL